MKRLRATPIAMIILKDINNLEHDAASQYKFNRFWAIFWAIQMPLVVLLGIHFPHFWLAISVMYFTQASLWANFATHFGAMSSALAAMNTSEKLISQVQDVGEDVEDIHTVAEVLHPDLLGETA